MLVIGKIQEHKQKSFNKMIKKYREDLLRKYGSTKTMDGLFFGL